MTQAKTQKTKEFRTSFRAFVPPVFLGGHHFAYHPAIPKFHAFAGDFVGRGMDVLR